MNLADLRPGDVVGVRKDLWAHEGVVSYPDAQGIPRVIAASGTLGRVAEQRWEAFAGSQPVKILGYPGRLPPETVIRRARAQIGRPYDPIAFNCQHFVRYAHGIEPFSWQVRLYGLGAAALTLWWLR